MNEMFLMLKATEDSGATKLPQGQLENTNVCSQLLEFTPDLKTVKRKQIRFCDLEHQKRCSTVRLEQKNDWFFLGDGVHVNVFFIVTHNDEFLWCRKT